MTLSKQLRWFLIGLLFVSTVAQAVDGGRVSTGGDPFNIRLEHTRSLLVATLRRLVSKLAMEERQTKSLLAGRCRRIIGNTSEDSAARIATCVDYIVSTAEMIQLCNEGPNKVEFLPIHPTPEQVAQLFTADYGRQYPQPVAGSTTFSCDTPILLHYDRTRDLRTRYLFMLLAHEFGHKVYYRGLKIDDSGAVGGFKHGFELLNTAAFALWEYAFAVESIPRDYASDMSMMRHFFSCELTFDGRSKEKFEFFNEVSPQLGNRYISTNISKDGPGHEITSLTKSYFADRRIFVKTIFQGGDCHTPSPADMSMTFLLADEEDHALVEQIVYKNLLCTSMSEVILKLDYDKDPGGHKMSMRCQFEGVKFVPPEDIGFIF